MARNKVADPLDELYQRIGAVQLMQSDDLPAENQRLADAAARKHDAVNQELAYLGPTLERTLGDTGAAPSDLSNRYLDLLRQRETIGGVLGRVNHQAALDREAGGRKKLTKSWDELKRLHKSAGVTRRFQLVRDVDIHGTSGTGPVVEGVQFGDGKVAMRWVTDNMPHSTVDYDSIDDAIKVHGHGGNTWIRWLDDEKGNQIPNPKPEDIGYGGREAKA